MTIAIFSPIPMRILHVYFSLAETHSLGGSKEDKCFILGVGGHVSLHCQHAAVVTRGAK